MLSAGFGWADKAAVLSAGSDAESGRTAADKSELACADVWAFAASAVWGIAAGVGFGATDTDDRFLACAEFARAGDGAAFFAIAAGVAGDAGRSCLDAEPDAFSDALPSTRPRSTGFVATVESASSGDTVSNGNGAFCAEGDGEL